MAKGALILWATVIAALCATGCGVVYDTGAKLRTGRMAKELKAGETSLAVHNDWGEPDLRTTVDPTTEVWSYVSRPNSNDIAATVLYTSTKPGDTDQFLDLKFVDDKLVSWNEVEHVMPAKRGAGFSYGLGPSGAAGPVSHY